MAQSIKSIPHIHKIVFLSYAGDSATLHASCMLIEVVVCKLIAQISPIQ